MNAPASTAAAAPNGQRKRVLLALTAVFAAAGIAYGAYWFVHGRNFESTDNAYVQGNIVQVTPQITGTVLAIGAQDTDFVKAGQSLVKLDPADAQVALDQAQAQLAQTVREVRTLYANNATLAANVALRQAELARANAEAARAEEDVARRQPLVASGAVSNEELEHSRTALAAARSAQASAQAAVAAAQEALQSNKALTEGVSVEDHPNVQRAAARVREAFLAYKRAELVAPVSGFIAKRSVQVGQRIAPGAPLMAIVPLDQLWVDANFKEVQLRNMRIGQPVTLTADVYGNRTVYHGRIAGLGAGTGAAFALLPAQNATGNWIKVVQRVPVRVALDPQELAQHPLRVGLSMEAEVDVRDQSGKVLADGSAPATVDSTPVLAQQDKDADALVERIIAANLGRRPALAAARSTPRAGAARLVSLRQGV
jgi:membrane fusion protein (multidrug efflux system)